jgi:predicted DNA-binding transcriptional regulator AlpA
MKPKAVVPGNAADARRAIGYFSEDDVCAILNIVIPTLRNRISTGTAPPSYKVGNRHLFKIAELDAWIKRRRVQRGAA